MNYRWIIIILDKVLVHIDMLHNFSEDDKDYEPTSDDEQHFVPTFSHHIQCDLFEHMSFVSKEAVVMNIKQYHIEQGYTFVVVESKSDRYVAKCTNYGNGC